MQLDKTIKQKRSLGALRKANKTKPRSPDLTGQMKLQRHTAAAIVEQFSRDDIDEVVCNIAGWKNQDYKGPYLKIDWSPRFVARGDRWKEMTSEILIINDNEEGVTLKKSDPATAFRLPQTILATVDAICAREDLTRSQVFRRSIMEYLKNQNAIVTDLNAPKPQEEWFAKWNQGRHRELPSQ